VTFFQFVSLLLLPPDSPPLSPPPRTVRAVRPRDLRGVRARREIVDDGQQVGKCLARACGALDQPAEGQGRMGLVRCTPQ